MSNEAARKARYARSEAADYLDENPVMIGVLGLAAGLLIGALLPRTRLEDRNIGQWRDEAAKQGMAYARQASLAAKDYGQEALRDVRQEAEKKVTRSRKSSR